MSERREAVIAELENLGEQLSVTQRSLAAERARRHGAEALVEELVRLSGARERRELALQMVTAAQRLLGAEEVALFHGAKGESLVCYEATAERWQGRCWLHDDFIARVVSGVVVLVARPDLHPSWQSNGADQRGIGAALHLGLEVGLEEVVMLASVHRRRGAFGPEGRRRAQLLLRSLEQAWRQVSANEREAALRREAEEANRALREARDALLVARDEAESASRAKSAFLAQMSHELRTPLAAIIGLTDLALEGDGGEAERPRELVAMARESAEHLLAVLNDVLDLSKIEAGKLSLERIPIDIAAIAQESVDLTAVRARDKGLSLRVELELGDHRLRVGDPLRLKQVLLNLLSNAVKFTSEGGIVLSVRLLPDDLGGVGSSEQIAFEVRDSGIGIPQRQLATIFDAFRQVDESTARRYGGTGLGLTICRRLARLFGGELSAHSEVGQGSTFRFVAPFPLAQQPERTTGPIPSFSALLPWESLRVLVVEDNRINQLVVRRLLERQGHHVVVADDGQAALDLLQEGPGELDLELVLMDIQMPGLDGLQTTAAIRELSSPGAARLPIVALTANAMSGERERCLAAGMDGYLSKPLREEALREVIERLSMAGKLPR